MQQLSGVEAGWPGRSPAMTRRGRVIVRASLAPSISARHAEIDRFGERRFVRTVLEDRQGVTRDVAIVALPLHRVGDCRVALDQLLRIEEVVPGLVALFQR